MHLTSQLALQTLLHRVSYQFSQLKLLHLLALRINHLAHVMQNSTNSQKKKREKTENKKLPIPRPSRKSAQYHTSISSNVQP